MRKKLSQKLCIIDFLCIFASLLFLGVLALLAKTYHIPVQQARQDAMAWVSSLKKCNVIID